MKINAEAFTPELAAEILPLAQKCWEESTEGKKETCAYYGERDFAVEPDTEAYLRLAEQGLLLVITLRDDGTRWQDGPLTIAARYGAICYLDEIVEARQDTTVVIHPLTDNRRVLPLEKTGELVSAHPDFQLVISYNPGYQSVMKDLKQSTKQRFGALDFNYPEHTIEEEIVAHETGVSREIAGKLVSIAKMARNLKGHGLDEGISTRMLIYAANLIVKNVEIKTACRVALVSPITDDPDMRDALDAAVTTFFG